MATPKAVSSGQRAVRTSRADKSPAAATHNFMERLPPEILIRILSYLDASALFTISHVNKLFYQLANKNALWKKIYMFESIKRKPRSFVEQQMATLEVENQSVGYWKHLYFRTISPRDMPKLKRYLRHIHLHTGLPSQTERLLRKLNLSWELTVTDKSGREVTIDSSWSQFSEASVTLCWSGGDRLLQDQQISTLELHAVRGIALHCPGLKKPGYSSLMEKLDMQTLTKSMQVIGQDRLVELRLLRPGVTIGLWRDQCCVAFVLITLHFHRLVERSVSGSPLRPYVVPTVKPPFDDTDPEYGLHGYHLHISLHDTLCVNMSESFPQLFCRKTNINDGLIQLVALSKEDSYKVASLSGNISLPWRCEALLGAVKNCCVLDLTLLDEFKNPFWCVATPVSMAREETNSTYNYDYDGEQFLIHYQDSDGQVKIKLWMDDKKQFNLMELIVYVSVHKVNKHFSRDY